MYLENGVLIYPTDEQREAMDRAATQHRVPLGGMALAALKIATKGFTDFSEVIENVERRPVGRPRKPRLQKQVIREAAEVTS